jgi:hypothetical protein
MSNEVGFSNYRIVGNIETCFEELHFAANVLDQLVKIRQSEILRNTSSNKEDYLTSGDFCRKGFDWTRLSLHFAGSSNHNCSPAGSSTYSGALPPVAPYISPDT